MSAIKTEQLGEQWNFILTRGDAWPAENFNLVDQDGVAVNPTSVKMQIKADKEDTTAVKTLTNVTGFIVSGNNVKFDTSVDLAVGSYYYDLQVTLSSGKIYTQYHGKVTVKTDITDAA